MRAFIYGLAVGLLLGSCGGVEVWRRFGGGSPSAASVKIYRDTVYDTVTIRYVERYKEAGSSKGVALRAYSCESLYVNLVIKDTVIEASHEEELNRGYRHGVTAASLSSQSVNRLSLQTGINWLPNYGVLFPVEMGWRPRGDKWEVKVGTSLQWRNGVFEIKGLKVGIGVNF